MSGAGLTFALPNSTGIQNDCPTRRAVTAVDDHSRLGPFATTALPAAISRDDAMNNGRYLAAYLGLTSGIG